MSHTHFTRDSRVALAALLRIGTTQAECARQLGFNRTTVCLEIKRNRDPDGVYRGAGAHRRYLARRKWSKQPYRKIENDKRLRRHIVRKMKRFWSPEQIAGRLKRVAGETIVCHETIYAFVYTKRPDLVFCLRFQKSRCRKKHGTKARMARNKASKVRMIDERPAVVDERSRIGDWEGDTIVGKEKTQRILTYVERVSGFGMAEKLDTVTAEHVEAVTERQFKNLPSAQRHTLTRDNGVEFGDYDQTLEAHTGLSVFRAHAYSSYERGSNENWNGLMRQFFPKGIPFATVSSYQVRRATRLLNDRPRKRLGYATPREVFRGCCDSG